MNYVVFNDDGEIIRCGTCPDDQLDIQGPVGFVLEGDAAPSTHYVLNGVITAYSTEQAAAKATRTSRWHDWSNSSMSWVDSRDVDIHKLQKWEEIKTIRAAKCAELLTVGAMTFDATAVSQQQINGAVTLALLAPSDWTIDWTLGDNTTATLTKAEMIAVGVALGARTSAIYAQGRVLREAIDAATTAAEVEGITWG